jgi:threonine synthase
MLTGLARDGGLYVPEVWPQLSPATIASFFGRPYWEVAVEVIKPFVAGDISDADLGRMANEAYATFRHPAVVPLDQFGPNQFVLELFHGPTLAFKDVAMQLLSRLMDHVLAQRGQRTTIAVATSGDTGGAAVEAFANRDSVDLIVLFPDGRISDVQRRTASASRSPASNRRRSKFDDTWMSIDGDVVSTTPLVRYSPVASVRASMSLSLVAMISRSIGRPIRFAA